MYCIPIRIKDISLLLFAFAVFIGTHFSFGLNLSVDICLSFDVSIPYFDCYPLKEVFMKLLSKTVEVMGHVGGVRPERQQMQSGIWSRGSNPHASSIIDRFLSQSAKSRLA